MQEPRYEPGVKQSQVPKALCQRAAWYLNNVGRDATKYKRLTIKEFNAAYSAILSINVPVHCETKGTGANKRIKCFCYPPLSGLAGKRKRRKGGKRK